MSARQFYLRSYPIPDGMAAHAAAVEHDGWDGLLLTDTHNLSMDVFASRVSRPRRHRRYGWALR